MSGLLGSALAVLFAITGASEDMAQWSRNLTSDTYTSALSYSKVFRLQYYTDSSCTTVGRTAYLM